MWNTKLYALFMISVMLTGVLSLSLVIALSDTVTITGTGTLGAIPPLHVEGRYIKDVFGNTVTLRGVNYNRWIDTAYCDWIDPASGSVTWATWSPTLAAADLDVAKNWGCNVWRVLITAEWWIDDTTGFHQRIKDFLSLATQRGIYVVLVPWRVSDSGSNPNMPYPPENDVGDTDVISSQGAFVDFWASVASELKTYDNVLFDLWNEPHGSNIAEWMNVQQQCINVIRNTGAENLIMVEKGYGILPDRYQSPVGRWALDWVENYPLNGSNIVYSTHCYWGLNNNWDMNSYDNIKDGYGNNCYLYYVLNTLQKPVWIGEIGANIWFTGTDLDKEMFWFTNTLAFWNELDLGYAAWVFWGEGQAYYLFSWAPNLPPTVSGTALINAMTG